MSVEKEDGKVREDGSAGGGAGGDGDGSPGGSGVTHARLVSNIRRKSPLWGESVWKVFQQMYDQTAFSVNQPSVCIVKCAST